MTHTDISHADVTAALGEAYDEAFRTAFDKREAAETIITSLKQSGLQIVRRPPDALDLFRRLPPPIGQPGTLAIAWMTTEQGWRLARTHAGMAIIRPIQRKSGESYFSLSVYRLDARGELRNTYLENRIKTEGEVEAAAVFMLANSASSSVGAP